MNAIATLRLSRVLVKNSRFLINPQKLNTLPQHYYAAAIIQYSQMRFPASSRLSYYSTASTTNSSNETQTEPMLDHATYERVCSETLESLCDYFEEVTEQATDIAGSDVAFGDGVLTVNLGREHGTYVINRQSPNKQIWLSSPTSGPKRYDFVIENTADDGRWIYKHTGETMHALLQQEIQNIFVDQPVDFTKLPYSSST